MTNLESLCDEVRAYLKERPAPQREVCEALGISVSWLTKFLCAKTNNPSIQRLDALSRWVEMDRRMKGTAA